MWFGEPHPSPERSSPTRLSTSGQTKYKGWSCRVYWIQSINLFSFYFTQFQKCVLQALSSAFFDLYKQIFANFASHCLSPYLFLLSNLINISSVLPHHQFAKAAILLNVVFCLWTKNIYENAIINLSSANFILCTATYFHIKWSFIVKMTIRLDVV